MIIKLLLASGAEQSVADDGQRNIRLQRQKLSVRIVKGDDTIAYQKVLVSGVKLVFFKLAHSEAAIPVSAIQFAE